MYKNNLNNIRTIADRIVDAVQVDESSVKQMSDIRQGLMSRAASTGQRNASEVTSLMEETESTSQGSSDKMNSMLAGYINSMRTESQVNSETIGLQPMNASYTTIVEDSIEPGRPQSRTGRVTNAPEEIKLVINDAAISYDVDPNYLLGLAKSESSFDPNAQAETSSAGGLFQFLDSTWLQTIKKHKVAAGIPVDSMSNGELLALKKDPALNSMMGAAFASDNSRAIRQRFEREPNSADLYAYHHFGPTGGGKILEGLQTNPNGLAANLLGEDAVKANRNIFYKGGDRSKPRTVRELHSLLGFKVGS